MPLLTRSDWYFLIFGIVGSIAGITFCVLYQSVAAGFMTGWSIHWTISILFDAKMRQLNNELVRLYQNNQERAMGLIERLMAERQAYLTPLDHSEGTPRTH